MDVSAEEALAKMFLEIKVIRINPSNIDPFVSWEWERNYSTSLRFEGNYRYWVDVEREDGKRGTLMTNSVELFQELDGTDCVIKGSKCKIINRFDMELNDGCESRN